MKDIYRLPILVAFIFISNNGYAHHSAAMFDLENQKVVEGTVVKFQFTNPHVWIYLNVVDDRGETKVWKIEHVSPNVLKRQGWRRSSFKRGDKVTITLYPAKSGEPKGGFIGAVTADGTVLGKVEVNPESIPDKDHSDEN